MRFLLVNLLYNALQIGQPPVSIRDNNLKYFSERYRLPVVPVVMNIKHERQEKEIQVRRALDFLKTLSP